MAVGSVTLYFKAVGGSQWVSREMQFVEGDTYGFTIPAQRKSGTVYFYVNATDTSDNLASTLFDEDEYNIMVEGMGEDFTMYYILGTVLAILMVVLVLLVIRKFSRDDPEPMDNDISPPVEEIPSISDAPPEPKMIIDEVPEHADEIESAEKVDE